MSQSLPNQVNDFNAPYTMRDDNPQGRVAIPSKPGQRLQSLKNGVSMETIAAVAIPSKPGQRLQYSRSRVRRRLCLRLSQSLPNQVNDFNKWRIWTVHAWERIVAIPSKPGQRLQYGFRTLYACGLQERRNPFQTRSTTSIDAEEELEAA